MMISDKEKEEFFERAELFRNSVLELITDNIQEESSAALYCFALCDALAIMIHSSEVEVLEELSLKTIQEKVRQYGEAARKARSGCTQS